MKTDLKDVCSSNCVVKLMMEKLSTQKKSKCCKSYKHKEKYCKKCPKR